MILNFSKNPLRQIVGIVFWNRYNFLFFVVCAAVAFVTHHYYEFNLPPIPVSILGGALAIFLGFRNSSAYDRWWEARKVWGSVVNNSRSLGLELITYPIGSTEAHKEEIDIWRKTAILRHIAWLYALKASLRKQKVDLSQFLSENEINSIQGKQNLPAQILVLQGNAVEYAFEKGWIEEFRFNALIGTLKKFYDDQGKAERIKNTVFPFYYNYFTLFFLWLFTMSLPFALVGLMNSWWMIPMSILISFAFFILNKSGVITETPFQGTAADTPMSHICRTIEIDLLQMIDTDEAKMPSPLPTNMGRFGVEFQD
ncbi:MAG: bestrophin family ion channel [Crocinitomicaceae bacterium]|nr:bestrophin family ion channel [Crocinitomicaceae bacterium]